MYGTRMKDLIDDKNPMRRTHTKKIHNKTKKKRKTLMKQYESLNSEVRDQFNRKFIEELETQGVISVSELL